jgi:hypothetical protein
VAHQNHSDLAWLSGLFEGEGSIQLRPVGRPQLQIIMTDEDVLRRVLVVAGVGHITGPRRLPSGKDAWRWSVTRTEHAVGLAMAMYSFLGQRRQARIREVLSAWRAAPVQKRFKPRCVHGHPLSGDNLFIHEGRRRCRKCRIERSRGAWLRRKEAC